LSFQLSNGFDWGFRLGSKNDGNIKVLMNFIGYFLVISLDTSGVGPEVLYTLLFEEARKFGLDLLKLMMQVLLRG
jgi:hypothetical protein